MNDAELAERTLRWRNVAVEIAWEIDSGAVWLEGMCAFHGATAPDRIGGPPRFRSYGGDLYEGSAGIARFLGLAAQLESSSRLRDTALSAMRHAFGHWDGWSLFSGGLGIGLVGLELAERLDAPELIAPAVHCIERASAAALAEGGAYDLLAGQAGVIIGLCRALAYNVNGAWSGRAVALGQALLAAAVPEGAASGGAAPLSWPMTAVSDERLCGLAHGASGVALAFETLATVAPDQADWLNAARRARAFERGHYSSEAGSWADLRGQEPGTATNMTAFPHMWCHGSIGITAERIGAAGHDLLARADAVGGLAGARAHARRLLAGPVGAGGGDAVNGSLCHGLGGLVDLFIDASNSTDDLEWITLARDLGDLMINDRRNPGGWRSGIPGGWPAPGLMMGSAGIGWAMFRLADPSGVPSGWRAGPALP